MMLTRHLIILFVYEEISHLSCGSKVGHPQHVLPLHNKIFLICCIFCQNLAHLYVGTPPEELARTPTGNIVSVPAPTKEYMSIFNLHKM